MKHREEDIVGFCYSFLCYELLIPTIASEYVLICLHVFMRDFVVSFNIVKHQFNNAQLTICTIKKPPKGVCIVRV